MSNSWLHQQRKGELLELADELGLDNFDGLLKADLELAIDNYLTKNASEFTDDARFQPYYNSKRRSEGSPIKKEPGMAPSDLGMKSLRKRVTRATEELASGVAAAGSSLINGTEDESSEPEGPTTRLRSAALARTPGAQTRASVLALAESIALPSSPADAMLSIRKSSALVSNKVTRAYTGSKFQKVTDTTRVQLSSVVSVQLLIFAWEVFQLRKEVLSDRYAFAIPTLPILRNAPYAVHFPDAFLLFTSSFWGPVVLWTISTILVPLAASFVFNWTSQSRKAKSYAFDPLTFNVVKALLVYVVYGQDWTVGGWVDLEYVARINSAFAGGYQGVIVHAGLGVLVTLYEALLDK